MPDVQIEDSDNFSFHLHDFIGETVTVFTISGGESGHGLTGILLEVTNCYIRLLIKPSSKPFTSQNDNRYSNSQNRLNRRNRHRNHRGIQFEDTPHPYIYPLGAAADVPIYSIASFIHNSL